MPNIYGVIGANYGDEGKGQTVNHLCKQHDGTKIVVCTNGSAQRGHTVIEDDKRHVFHHFGSGTIVGADTYFAKDFIVNPLIFEEEENELKEKNIIRTMCFAHKDCRVATIYDMMANQVIELSRVDKHGSCGCGVWETIQRYDNGPHLTLGEIYKLSEKELLYHIIECKDFCQKRLRLILLKENLTFDVYDEYNRMFDSTATLLSTMHTMNHFLNSIRIVDDSGFLNNYETVVFENGQGLLLDYRIDKKLSTPSITGSEAISDVINDKYRLSKDSKVKLYYATRTYITRHGSSDFVEKCDKEEINPDIVDETNQPNPYQGTLMFGKLNHAQLYQRVKEDAGKMNVPYSFGLSVTHINDYNWQDKEMPVGDLWLKFN